jgi:type IV pilus assembly protein PilX
VQTALFLDVFSSPILILNERAQMSLNTHAPSQQKGLVLLISLIVLVVMTLAAIALVRSMISSNQIANNLALRQGTTAAADLALEKARIWLVDRSLNAPNELNADSADNGYRASNANPIGVTEWPINGNTWQDGVAWVWANPEQGNAPLLRSAEAKAINKNGYKAAYFIQRSCASDGVKTPNRSGCDLQKLSPSEAEANSNYQMIYKITVRIEGPKNTVSFYQSTLF